MADQADNSHADVTPTTRRSAPETRFREVLDGMGEGFIVLDREFRIAEINAEGVRLDGRAREEILSRHLLAVWPEAEHLPTWPAYQEAMEDRQARSFEYRHRSAVHDVWLEVRVYPVPEGLAVFYRDVSERHRAADALQASEEFNRRILQSSADCIKVLSLDGRLEFMSEGGMCVMEVEDFGTVKDACWPDFWEGEEQDKAVAALEAARGGGIGRFQGFARTAKGSPRWWDVVVTAISGPDGRPEKLLSVSRDVTEARQREAALKESESTLGAVLDALPVGVIIADAHGALTRDNAAHRELWGVPPETRSWEEYGEWVGYWPETGARIGAEQWALSRALLTGETVQGELVESERFGTGERRVFINNAAPVRDEAGRIIGGVVAELDVTERLATERALQETSRRLDAILINTQMAVFLTDADQRCLYANPAAERLTGYGFDDLRGRVFHDMLHHTRPDGSLYPREDCPIVRAYPAGEQIRGEEWLVAPDGSFYPVAFTVSPVCDEAGRPAGTVIEARNIAEELSAGERLTQLAAVTEQSRDFIGVTDLEGRPIYVNEAGRAMVGLTSLEAARAIHLIDYFAEPDQARIRNEALPGVARDNYWQGEVRFRRFDDGRTFPVLYNIFPVRGADGRIEAYATVTRDLSERRAAQEALREAEERLRLATDAAEVGFWDVDLVNDVLIWPPRVKAMFGISADSPVSMRDFYAGLHPEDAPATAEAFAAACDPSTRALYDVEYRTIGKEDGVLRCVAAKGRGIFDGDRCVRVIGTAIDISGRKRAEAELRELNQHLEERVAEEVAERGRAEEALRQAQKLEAVGQLTGGIAHDFNNLLTVVVGNIDMGLRALEAAGGDPRVRRALDSAQKGAERAAALTQRLLAFSRRQPLAPKPVDVDKLALGMSDLLNRSLGETVKLEIVTSPGLWRVEADPNQLESAILNLAINARDAMAEGGTLTIETANARLDEAYSAQHAEVAPGHYVVVAVSDTGHGMPKELLEKVFEPFFTTKEVGKGTGLGLSMVYGFVKQSGGHVKIYSEADRGTTVKLYLPRLMSDAAVEDEAVLTPGLEVSRRAEVVLVVEDDDDVRAYTVECLRELGYRVLEAHDGHSALRLLDRQGNEVDLMFTDVVMPGMSGRELVEAARANRPDLRVLYTSGYTRDAIVHGGRLDPGVEMIAKPFTFQALAQKIRDVLDAGTTKRVLVAQADATVRALAAEALSGSGYTADEAATAAEVLGRVRAAQGRYDAVIVDEDLPDKPGEAVLAELRALHCDLPLLLAVAPDREAAVRSKLASDRCADVIGKPFTGQRLAQILRDLGVRCARRN